MIPRSHGSAWERAIVGTMCDFMAGASRRRMAGATLRERTVRGPIAPVSFCYCLVPIRTSAIVSEQ